MTAFIFFRCYCNLGISIQERVHSVNEQLLTTRVHFLRNLPSCIEAISFAI